jgi:hypothetical protein
MSNLSVFATTWMTTTQPIDRLIELMDSSSVMMRLMTYFVYAFLSHSW